MKHKIIHIYDETFKQNYYILYGAPLKEYIKNVKKYTNFIIEDKENYHTGKCEVYLVKGVRIIFVWTMKRKIPILAHELSHAVYFTLRDRQIKISDDSEEVYAYLLERLLREVL